MKAKARITTELREHNGTYSWALTFSIKGVEDVMSLKSDRPFLTKVAARNELKRAVRVLSEKVNKTVKGDLTVSHKGLA